MAGTSARLAVAEQVIEEPRDPAAAKYVLDLHMHVLLGARERTRGQWVRLLTRAGFVIESITPTRSLFSIITAVPAAAPAGA